MKTKLISGAFIVMASFGMSAPLAVADSQTFFSTGAEQSYTVPAGATSLLVEAKGAAGGDTMFLLGGRGASVAGNVDVAPGQTLYAEVGGVGECNGAGLGGFGLGGNGAGGGSATDLRTVSVTDGGGSLCGSGQSAASLNSRLVVAAGGGGAATTAASEDTPVTPSGGDAGQPGIGTDGEPGQPGTGAAGGAGGSPDGGAGDLGLGGTANQNCCPNYAGGGGGGGLYGGGAGGWAYSTGGGGGGGSSLVPAGGTFDLTSDPAQLKITPVFPVPKTQIKGKPKYSQSADTRFRFASSIEGSTFMCKLDGGKYKSCHSPKNYKNLKPGPHTFYVYAISPFDAVDESAATVEFKVKRKR